MDIWGANVRKSGIYDFLSQFGHAESKMADTKNIFYVLTF